MLLFAVGAVLIGPSLLVPDARADWSSSSFAGGQLSAGPSDLILATNNGNCDSGRIAALDSAGGQAWSAPADAHGPYRFCPGRAVTDAAGDIYIAGYRTSDSTPAIISLTSSGELRWMARTNRDTDPGSEAGTPGYSTDLPPRVALGRDGNVYALAGLASSARLLGFAASDGHPLLDVDLHSFFNYGSSNGSVMLQATKTSLVVSANGETRTFGYNGVLLTTDAASPRAQGDVSSVEAPAAQGASFTLWQSSALSYCRGRSDGQYWDVVKHSANGGGWTYRSQTFNQPCVDFVSQLRALPDGGAVVTADPRGTAGDAVTVLGADGRVRWSKRFDDVGVDRGYGLAVRVTTSGEIVLFINSSILCPDMVPGHLCHQVTVRFLAAANGSDLRTPIVVNDVGSAFANTTPSLFLPPLVLPNRFVMGLYGGGGSFENYPRLREFDAAGLKQDYEIAIAAAPSSPVPSPISLAALGDSVSAGEGIGYGWQWSGVGPDLVHTWFRDSTGAGTWADTTLCHRREEAFGPVLATRNGWKVTHLACTGATAQNGLIHPQLQPAQLAKAFDGTNPDVLTLTIGANDVDFKGVVRRCYLKIGDCGSPAETTKRDGDLKTQRSDLESVLDEIANKAHEAHRRPPTVALATYYNPFPQPWQSCADTSMFSPIRAAFPLLGVVASAFSFLGISANEEAWLTQGLNALNRNIRAVAQDVKYRDFVLPVDLDAAFKQHRWCSADPWVYGPSALVWGIVDPLALLTGNAVGPNLENAAPFHPTRAGQEAIADAFQLALSGMQDVPTGQNVLVNTDNGVSFLLDRVVTAGRVSIDESTDRPIENSAPRNFALDRAWNVTANLAITDGGATVTVPGRAGESIYQDVGGSWEHLDTTYADGNLSARVSSLSPLATGRPSATVTAALTGPDSADAGAAVDLDGSASHVSDGSAPTLTWDFGDGAIATGTRVTHRFTTPGSYTVVMTARAEGGAVDTRHQEITVNGLLPSAVISGPSDGFTGDSLTFDASNSSSPTAPIQTFAWTFINGDQVEIATGKQVQLKFARPGIYRITLVVSDTQGNTDTQVQSVSITEPNQPPVTPTTTDPTPTTPDANPAPKDTTPNPLAPDTTLTIPPPSTRPSAGPRASVPATIALKKLQSPIKVAISRLKARSKVAGTLKLGSKAITTSKATAAASGKATLTFKLSKAVRKKIRRKSKLTVRIQVVGNDGIPTSLSGTIRVS